MVKVIFALEAPLSYSLCPHKYKFSSICFEQTIGQSAQPGVNTQGHYAPAVAAGAIAQPRPTGMGPQPLPLGSDMHGYHIDDEEMMRLKAERGGRAGGWSLELSKKRALEEAFGSIWI